MVCVTKVSVMTTQQTDIVEEMYSPKSAAASFVHTLCTTRQKGNLEALMQQVGSRKHAELDGSLLQCFHLAVDNA